MSVAVRRSKERGASPDSERKSAADDITVRTASEKEARSNERLRLLDELFVAEGFRNLNVSRIAKKLRCSKRSLYELARSKQALVQLVLARRLSRIRQDGWHAASLHDSPPERIRAYLAPGITATDEMGAKYLSDIETDTETARLLDDHQRRRIDGLRTLIEEGIRQGFYKGFHPYLVAEVMMTALQRMRQQDFLLEAGISQVEAYAELGRLIQAGLMSHDTP